MKDDQDLKQKIEYYEKALKFFSKFKNSSLAAKTLLDLGNVYRDQNNYEKAIEKYKVAYHLYKDEKNISGEATALKLIADIYKIEDNYPEARRYYQRALKKFQSIKNNEMEMLIKTSISRCYQAEGALEDAIDMEKEVNKLDLNQAETQKINYNLKELEKMITDVWPTRSESYFLILLIIITIFAELITIYYSLSGGIILQIILILILIMGSTLTNSLRFSYLLQAMILLPLIRIMSLLIPLTGIRTIYWFLIILAPLIAAVLIIMQSQNLNWKSVGFIKGNLPLQLTIGLTGLVLGYIEYQIIHPAAIISDLNLYNLIFAGAIIIVTTGFLEELIFRGIIQRNAENHMGKFWGVIFASLLFTILNIGWNSLADILFIFLVSLFYGYVFQKTRSILGIGISHGICNMVLFLILPFL